MPKKKKNKSAELIFIIDRSGSMGRLTENSVGSFNSYIEEMKSNNAKAKVTLVAFNDTYEVLIDRRKLQDVYPLESSQIRASGSTALNDAIGRCLKNAKKNRKTMCMIQTDGAENASSDFTNADIKALIEAKTADGWEFMFTGVGVDNFMQGTAYGLKPHQINQVDRSSGGMRDLSATRSKTTVAYLASDAPANTAISNSVNN